MSQNTKILSCTCANKFQDERYGAGLRVHNFATKGLNGSAGRRCTVCVRVKAAPAPVDLPVAKVSHG